ncbi:MAG: ribulose-phosphate 3-epimerase [Candidatus Cloacimonadota bacterium]|nr:ribulose-phosphate 3-epimerase [Candidatus Cloacimonadota bacterium]
MKHPIQIAPSILAADILKIEREIKSIENGGADLIHVDIMDGHFVPNLTFGPVFVKKLRFISNIPLDVHLMISNPEKYVENFISAGADYLSFHIETDTNHRKLLASIKKKGVKAGLALNPNTNIEKVFDYLDLLDFVLIMTVFPGFGGQKYISSCTNKISRLFQYDKNHNVEIEVDGGINFTTAKIAKNAGANILVSGSFIFENSNYKKVIKGLKDV